jgi:hypothetical protein
MAVPALTRDASVLRLPVRVFPTVFAVSPVTVVNADTVTEVALRAVAVVERVAVSVRRSARTPVTVAVALAMPDNVLAVARLALAVVATVADREIPADFRRDAVAATEAASSSA